MRREVKAATSKTEEHSFCFFFFFFWDLPLGHEVDDLSQKGDRGVCERAATASFRSPGGYEKNVWVSCIPLSLDPLQ